MMRLLFPTVYLLMGVFFLGLFRRIKIEEENSNPIPLVIFWPVLISLLIVINICDYVYNLGFRFGKILEDKNP